MTILPDVLAKHLDVVFCGTGVGRRSARLGQYYADPSNLFWQALYDAGFTPRVLEPHEASMLPAHGIGLTDPTKHHVGSDAQLQPDQSDRARLERTIRQYTPRVLCFVGKKAGKAFLQRSRVPYGDQDTTIGTTVLWLVPSPSGLARRYWSVEPWRELREYVEQSRKSDP